MSTLVKETDTELFLEQYLHHDPDSYSEWEGEDGKYPSGKYSDKVHEVEHYAFYEVRVSYKINKETGEVTYLGVE